MSRSILWVLIFAFFLVRAQQNYETIDYDLNGKRITYYPESLMISRNPRAIVFYANTKLLNLFVDLRTPSLGQDFTVNNTCDENESHFLGELLAQIRTVQKSMQRLLSAHGYTSLIECDSYLRRYFQYSTGFASTMSCPYSYKKSLQLCKSWALQHCNNITPRERKWLHNSRRKRSLPWACTAGVFGIPRFLYTSFGGSCESNDMFGVIQAFGETFTSMNVMQHLIRTVNGKTVYLAKISDKLVTKVNNLQSSLRQVDSNFHNWQAKLQQFSVQENCHLNNFLEFLSKFSVEVTRTFSTLLRFIEINDVLHQTHNLHNKQLVGFDDLPSFLATEIQLRLKSFPSLHTTADTLEAGFPLLMQPLVDYLYKPSKSMGINILFTIPELHTDHNFCTIEYLMPIKYNISGTCFHGPVLRDELALLQCQNSEFILKKSLLDKCFYTSTTFVCPQHILQLLNNTDWLGLPWNKNTKLDFARKHQKAKDCTNLHDLFHLGGRFYLSAQQGKLPVYNITNGSTHIIPLSPLMVYHFPCDLTFDTQQTGLGQCPKSITMHVPMFTTDSFHYVPWKHDDNNDILQLHYKSLNISPPLTFDNSTLQSLDETYRLLDGQLTNHLASLRKDISQIHTVQTTTLNDSLTYFALILTLLNTIALCILYCGNFRKLPKWPIPFSKRKRTSDRSLNNPESLTTDEPDQELETILPSSSASESHKSKPTCPDCHKSIVS